MNWIIVGFFMSLWIFGFVNGWTLGGALYLLPLAALLVAGIDLAWGRQDAAY